MKHERLPENTTLDLILEFHMRNTNFIIHSIHSLIFRRNAMHCIAPYAIIMCVCVCLSVCVCAAFMELRKTV